MGNDCHNENSQFNVKSGPFYILTIIMTILLLSGCGTSNKVIATWHGDLIREERVNEKVVLDRPVLKEIDWDTEPGALRVLIKQPQKTIFDLKRSFEKMQITRTTKEYPSLYNTKAMKKNPLAAVFLAPLWVGLAPVVLTKYIAYDVDLARQEKEFIPKFKRSSGNEMTIYANCSQFVDKMKAKYVKNRLGEEQEVISNMEEYSDVAASNLTFNLKSVNELTPAISFHSDNNGFARILFTKEPTEALSLKPSELKISSKWKGKWSEIGSTYLSKKRCDHIIEHTLAESMAMRGIPDLPPFAKLSVKVPDSKVIAGTDCDISLTVENTGKGEFYRLEATSESIVPALDGLKFKFGKLASGNSLTLTQTSHIPHSQSTKVVNVSFKWSELNGYEPDLIHTRLLVAGLQHPVFATSVKVLDDNSGRSVGNGDGRIQKGEAIDLLVTVKNVGDGIARKTSVRIEGIVTEGIIFNVTEKYLGKIAVGESKQARLTVTTKKAASTSRLTPTIHVVDHFLNVEQKEPLDLVMESELSPSIMAYNSIAYVANDEITIRNGADNETAVIARAKEGSILKTTGELGEWIRVELPKVGTGWIHRSDLSFEPIAQTDISPQNNPNGIIEILEKAAPMIVLANLYNNSTFLVPKIQVSGVIADNQGVHRVVYRVNGRIITPEGKRGIRQSNMQREVRFNFTAELTLGDNEIEITAWDNEGLQAQKITKVTYEKEKGNVFIICIGINNYNYVPPLKYATADAQAMADRLQQGLGVPEENVHVLLNEEATLSNIKNTLGVKIRQQAGKIDTVIIYFSGHGAPEPDSYSLNPDGVNKYLLPINAEIESLYSTALPMEEVRNIFRRLLSERVIFIADTCYSGAAGGRTLMPEGSQYRSINQEDLLVQLKKTGKGRVILTASQGSEVSLENDELGHGVFSYYLLQGLAGKADQNGDRRITVTELYNYVSKEVPKATYNRQHPVMKLDEMVGDVIVGVLEY